MKVDIGKLQTEIFSEICELCSEDGMDREFAISEIHDMQDGDVETGHIDLAVHKLLQRGMLRVVTTGAGEESSYGVTPKGYEEYLSSD